MYPYLPGIYPEEGRASSEYTWRDYQPLYTVTACNFKATYFPRLDSISSQGVFRIRQCQQG